ncbi:MAG TPA: nucleotidyltransferase domain-containing protein [Candidatus Aminicenantes bacterium]|nr:nucleotidyltransferase domain-containing protein [Candidatus Aminicenantes bacterium]
MARILNISASRVLEVLELFRKNAVVNRETVGRSSQWGLNQESIVVEEVSSLINVERKIYMALKSRIYETLIREKSIQKVILYGSVARKKEKPESDIDVLILVTTKKDKELAAALVGKLNKYLLPRYGNVISETIYSEREWKDMEKTKIFKKIESEGEIILIREKIRDEMRDLDKVRSEINWDKVAEVYGLKELIKNIKF